MIPLIHVERHTYENVVKEGNKTADFDVKNNTQVEKLAKDGEFITWIGRASNVML